MKIRMFSAKWCAPCNYMKSSVLPKFAEKHPEIPIEIMDVDEPQNRFMMEVAGVKSIPAFFLLTDGDKHVKMFVGGMNLEKFEEWVLN